jgi:hypothetical protein
MLWRPPGKTPTRPCSCIEPLEPRFCPAGLLIQNRNGSLLISGDPNGDLSLDQIGATKWRITDGDDILGKFQCRRGLQIELGDDNDTIDLKLSDAGIAGRLLVDLGGGDDLLEILSNDGSRIGSSLKILGGDGLDTFAIGNSAGPLRIGTALTVSGGDDVDVATITDLNVTGSASVEDIDQLGIYSTVLHSLLLDTTGVASASSAEVASDTRVFGRMNVIGGVGPDDVLLRGRFSGPVFVSLAGGVNKVVSDGASFASSFEYDGNSGDDTIKLLGRTTIQGECRVSLGDGANQLEAYAGATFMRSVTILGGSEADNLVLGGDLRANLLIALGSGINSANLAGELRGSSLRYFGGGDADIVTYAELALRASVRVDLGGGDDQLTLSSNAFASAVFTGGDGSDRCVQNVRMPSTDVTITGFESIEQTF